jgi:hypothetical protein
MNAWVKEVIIIIAALLFSILISAAILSFFQGALASESDEEYRYYVDIRDTSNCTKENDTYCTSRGGCVHMYGQCQRQQCPGAFP